MDKCPEVHGPACDDLNCLCDCHVGEVVVYPDEIRAVPDRKKRRNPDSPHGKRRHK